MLEQVLPLGWRRHHTLVQARLLGWRRHQALVQVRLYLCGRLFHWTLTSSQISTGVARQTGPAAAALYHDRCLTSALYPDPGLTSLWLVLSFFSIAGYQ